MLFKAALLNMLCVVFSYTSFFLIKVYLNCINKSRPRQGFPQIIFPLPYFFKNLASAPCFAVYDFPDQDFNKTLTKKVCTPATFCLYLYCTKSRVRTGLEK